MSSSESEVAELRERVAKLEARVDALIFHSAPSKGAPPKTPPPLPQSVSVQGLLQQGEGFEGYLEGGARKDGPGLNLSPMVCIAAAGAVIFLAGVVYGLKVSIERGWFAPPMRVFAGACAGFVLGWISTRLLQRENRAPGLAGLRHDPVSPWGRPLRLAGYAWLSAAALKLLFHDLAQADLLLRAVAAVAVGAIFLGAALWANRDTKRNSAGDW